MSVFLVVVVMVVEVVALHDLHPFPPPAYLQFFAEQALAAEAESKALQIPGVLREESTLAHGHLGTLERLSEFQLMTQYNIYPLLQSVFRI